MDLAAVARVGQQAWRLGQRGAHFGRQRLTHFQAPKQFPDLPQQLPYQPVLPQAQRRPAQVVARSRRLLQVPPTTLRHRLLHLGFGHGQPLLAQVAVHPFHAPQSCSPLSQPPGFDKPPPPL